ncbi:methylmalonyl Co-A mutase-associated GTPase MeaB [Poritiphilus sp. M415]|uniref:Methylmalonyl Co-A mutase-associated GTPase MeaB n=1 Tax=Lentiprolixibacter aurantiacus TaxID=2993939 RepID=A0AAE3SP91_9FLAO|nr:methylmalonyl Co-A mutase-associated GTPase MeaB [Lentiprolixibacter aurantiacus]MCX2720449.1 methylmalonyl Co-A mutase-associated GTPase MeaB [Lentiprolixibacter aurantiacus]
MQFKRKKIPSVNELAEAIFAGNKTLLARGITLIESRRTADHTLAQELIERCLPKINKSIRIGITGVPGVGKSTFIERLGKLITGMGKKVAVLAVDPSSSVTRGSILGDKTRMLELSKDPDAFIRPSPTGESLGGVARKTRESVILCEAAGYEVILIETVGVGQSETAVHSMVDFFLLLKLAGAGDELQGIKRGIMEMADGILINKADGDNLKRAQRARAEFERALQLYPPKASGWLPKVSTCSALNNEGITELWGMIEEFIANNRDSGFFETLRREQNTNWFLQTVDERLKSSFYQHPDVKKELTKLIKKVGNNQISPFKAADLLLSSFKQN